VKEEMQEVMMQKADTVFIKPDCPPAKVVKGIKSHVAFGLAKTNVDPNQEMNVLAIADYMKQFPDSKATVTGYADNGTGSREINLRLAKQRAESVAKQLTEKYGISRDRLTISSMQDSDSRSRPMTGTASSS
jgi:major outer membrane protein ompA